MAQITLGDEGTFEYRNDPAYNKNIQYVIGEAYTPDTYCMSDGKMKRCGDVAEISTSKGTETVYGTPKPDTIYAKHAPATINAGNGDDKLFVEQTKEVSELCYNTWFSPLTNYLIPIALKDTICHSSLLKCTVTLHGGEGNDVYDFTKAFNGGCKDLNAYITDIGGKDVIKVPATLIGKNAQHTQPTKKKTGQSLELKYKHIQDNVEHELVVHIMNHYEVSGRERPSQVEHMIFSDAIRGEEVTSEIDTGVRINFQAIPHD